MGGDPGGCCVTQLSYSKNYSGCHVFLIFNFLFNLKTLDKREKIAKNRISQKSKEGFIWNQKHILWFFKGFLLVKYKKIADTSFNIFKLLGCCKKYQEI